MLVFRDLSRGLSPRVRQSTYACCSLALSALLAALLLVSCSNPFASSQPGATATALPANLPLAKLKWCGKPTMLFRDEGAVPSPTVTATATTTTTPTASATAGASPTVTTTTGASPTATASASPTTGPGTPTTITSWNDVKANLGFSVFLPANLPRDACLVSAQATIHDPTFGGSFLIGYLLPDHTSITLSEAPLTSQNTTFQCSVTNGSTTQHNPSATATLQRTASPTPLPLQLCSGAKETTNIVLSARRSVEYLQQTFNTLQPNVNWIPGS